MYYEADNSGTCGVTCSSCPDHCPYIVIISDDLSDDTGVLDEFEPINVICDIIAWPAIPNTNAKPFIVDREGRFFSGAVP